MLCHIFNFIILEAHQLKAMHFLPYTRYPDAESMFVALRNHFRTKEQANNGVEFAGEYVTPADPLISDKERVDMVIRETWKTTGYRFT